MYLANRHFAKTLDNSHAPKAALACLMSWTSQLACDCSYMNVLTRKAGDGKYGNKKTHICCHRLLQDLFWASHRQKSQEGSGRAASKSQGIECRMRICWISHSTWKHSCCWWMPVVQLRPQATSALAYSMPEIGI